MDLFKNKNDEKIRWNKLNDEIYTFTKVIDLFTYPVTPLTNYPVTEEGRNRAYEDMKEKLKLSEITRIKLYLMNIYDDHEELIKLTEENEYLKKRIESLKNDVSDCDAISILQSELRKKDTQIENLSIALKEGSFQISELVAEASAKIDQRIRNLEHAADLLGCSSSRFKKLEFENRYFRDLLLTYEAELKAGKDGSAVFTEDVMSKLNEADD